MDQITVLLMVGCGIVAFVASALGFAAGLLAGWFWMAWGIYKNPHGTVDILRERGLI